MSRVSRFVHLPLRKIGLRLVFWIPAPKYGGLKARVLARWCSEKSDGQRRGKQGSWCEWRRKGKVISCCIKEFDVIEIYSDGTSVCQQWPRSAIVPQLTIDGSLFDLVADIFGTPAVNLTADRKASTENLEYRSTQLLRQRLVRGSHGPCNLNDFIQRNRLGVLDVLLFFSIARRLLECSDNQTGCGWDD